MTHARRQQNRGQARFLFPLLLLLLFSRGLIVVVGGRVFLNRVGSWVQVRQQRETPKTEKV